MKHRRITLDLYTAHRDALVSYAGKLSGDRTGAEDIVQDAWMLLDRAPDPAAIREPLGYLRRIVRNLVFDQGRRYTRERTVMEADVSDQAQEIPDQQPSVEAQCADRQMVALVMDTIDALPDPQKTAIKMYHFEDLKLREIAERLGLSVSQVHSLIVDGMARCNQRRQQGA